MAKRPLALLAASLLFLYFPAELYARHASGVVISAGEFFISGVLPVILFFGLLRVTRVGWVALIGFVALWGLNDLYLFYWDHGRNIGALFSHLAIYSLSLGYFINPRVRTLYFDPKLCWWKSKRRYETNLPLLINDGRQWHYPVVKNVSEGGCFVETPHLLAINSKLALAIPLPVPLAVSVIRSEGEVRWVSRNPLRCGMGIEFRNAAPQHQRALRQYVRYQL